MRILGIDPGLATVGIGLIHVNNRAYEALDWLTITSSKGELCDRLHEIAKDLDAYVAETAPDIIVIERLFFSTNRKTAIDVAQARGALLLTVAKRGLPIIEPNPLELKLAITGDGKADKKQMQDMIVRTLKLKEIPTPDDAADALCLALFGAITHGRAMAPLPSNVQISTAVFGGK